MRPKNKEEEKSESEGSRLSADAPEFNPVPNRTSVEFEVPSDDGVDWEEDSLQLVGEERAQKKIKTVASYEEDDPHNSSAESFETFIRKHTFKLDKELGLTALTTVTPESQSPTEEIENSVATDLTDLDSSAELRSISKTSRSTDDDVYLDADASSPEKNKKTDISNESSPGEDRFVTPVADALLEEDTKNKICSSEKELVKEKTIVEENKSNSKPEVPNETSSEKSEVENSTGCDEKVTSTVESKEEEDTKKSVPKNTTEAETVKGAKNMSESVTKNDTQAKTTDSQGGELQKDAETKNEVKTKVVCTENMEQKQMDKREDVTKETTITQSKNLIGIC